MEYYSFHSVFFILFELIFSVLFCSKKRREITKQEESKQMTFGGKEDHNDLLVPFRPNGNVYFASKNCRKRYCKTRIETSAIFCHI